MHAPATMMAIYAPYFDGMLQARDGTVDVYKCLAKSVLPAIMDMLAILSSWVSRARGFIVVHHSSVSFLPTFSFESR